jgi:ABC-type nitrate/sulfonate/bicarbonate transport system substrate-binding protein
MATPARPFATALTVLCLTALVGCSTAPAPAASSQAANAPRSSDPASAGGPPSGPAQGGQAASAPAAPPAREKVRIAHVSNGATMGVIDIVKQSGMFDRYGVDAELTLIRSPLSVAALLAGEVDFNFIAARPIITSNLEGGDTVLVACGIPIAFWWVFAKPNISRPEDLKGQRVASGRRGSDLYAIFNLVAPRWGLGPDDYTTIQIDADTEKILALQNDAADAAVISVPYNLQAKALGLRQIADIGDLGVPWPASCLGTTKRFTEQRSAALRGVLQAYVAAGQWMKTHRNESIDMLLKFTETDDRAVLEEAFNTVLKYQAAVPYPTLEGVQTLLNSLDNEAAASAPPERFVDDRILRELDTAGFVQSLR